MGSVRLESQANMPDSAPLVHPTGVAVAARLFSVGKRNTNCPGGIVVWGIVVLAIVGHHWRATQRMHLKETEDFDTALTFSSNDYRDTP